MGGVGCTGCLDFPSLEYVVVCSIIRITVLTRGRAVAARQAHNLKVVGSSPTPATILKIS
ncbi:MAG: hypothetical protein UR96_C0028G0005 [candidate division WS6 bacterium GW2011_GWC1_36_11]|uniref:Uncharacterized protein n=1 Tax=candidate division WS6 bacterium GW2011_GWC1_36_11 TaxID=1619090 RepID=A0A0G0FWH7_9BACT|nr:MAG: hypothetical protein UR96_C0028G0005 [candidate division WS6 bacterium GW2011_GWC1_36_11]